jgi:hypothetical protein
MNMATPVALPGVVPQRVEAVIGFLNGVKVGFTAQVIGEKIDRRIDSEQFYTGGAPPLN